MDTEQSAHIEEFKAQSQLPIIEKCKNVNETKANRTLEEIQALERIWSTWMQQQQYQAPNFIIKEEDNKELSNSQLHKKNEQLNKFFSQLKKSFIDQRLFTLTTQAELTQFMDEATTQIQNKIRLFEDIQKLKLLSNYPTTTKRTYSKQANMILKKWLIENYNNPYPKIEQVEELVKETQLSTKQVLNWFINARNSLKNKTNQEKKFKQVVEAKFRELNAFKKRKSEKIE